MATSTNELNEKQKESYFEHVKIEYGCYVFPSGKFIGDKFIPDKEVISK